MRGWIPTQQGATAADGPWRSVLCPGAGEGRLALGTTARSVLGRELPLIDDAVTIEHLLSHRSGIGDYLDEGAIHAITDYLMPVPIHQLATTDGYLPVLSGRPPAFPAGERVAY